MGYVKPRTSICTEIWENFELIIQELIYLHNMSTNSWFASIWKDSTAWSEYRDQSRYAPSQWKTSLQCNYVSHWLGTNLNWSLWIGKGKVKVIHTRGSFHAEFSHCNSNSMEISFRSHPCCSEMIARKVCTWYNNHAVVACANFGSNTIPCSGVTLQPDFYRIWIPMEKSLVKWVQG